MNIRLWDSEEKRFLSAEEAQKELSKDSIEDSFFGLTLKTKFEIVKSTGYYDQVKFDELSIEEREAWISSNRTEGDWLGRELYVGDIVENGIGQMFTIIYDQGTASFLQQQVRMDIEKRAMRFNVKKRIGNIYENYDIINSATVQK